MSLIVVNSLLNQHTSTSCALSCGFCLIFFVCVSDTDARWWYDVPTIMIEKWVDLRQWWCEYACIWREYVYPYLQRRIMQSWLINQLICRYWFLIQIDILLMPRSKQFGKTYYTNVFIIDSQRVDYVETLITINCIDMWCINVIVV